MKKIIKTNLIIILLLFLVLGSGYAQQVRIINNPGQQVDIFNYVVKGKITIFEFFATWNGTSNTIEPYLQRLAQDPSYIIYKIDIKEWNSPVCVQYRISSIPYFKVFDKAGNIQFEGNQAYRKMMEILSSR